MNYSDNEIAKYNEIVDRLREGVLTVTFKKVDGSMRVMKCTLAPSYLPEDIRNQARILREDTGSNISVWDVEAGGWRSFRLDSITSVE